MKPQANRSIEEEEEEKETTVRSRAIDTGRERERERSERRQASKRRSIPEQTHPRSPLSVQRRLNEHDVFALGGSKHLCSSRLVPESKRYLD
jgi:hypothetical protein